MGLLNWIAAIRGPSLEVTTPHATGADFRVHAVTKIETFATSRLDASARQLLATFKTRLETVDDEPGHDPELIASVEFNIFKRTLRAARRDMAAELLDHIRNEMIVAESFNMTADLLVLVDRAVDDRLDTLAFGASALYDFKVEEIRERRSEEVTQPDKARKHI